MYQYQGFDHKLYSGNIINIYSDVKFGFKGYDLGIEIRERYAQVGKRVSLKKVDNTQTASAESKIIKMLGINQHTTKSLKIYDEKVELCIEYIVRSESNMVYLEIRSIQQV